MSSTKYIGMDVHTESISIAVRNSIGKLVMECVIETKASTIVCSLSTGCAEICASPLKKELWASWLYDLLEAPRHGSAGVQYAKEYPQATAVKSGIGSMPASRPNSCI